jgi:hypothetical protein
MMQELAGLTAEMSIEDATAFINLFNSLNWDSVTSIEDFST